MCGIVGSFKRKDGFKMYEQNLSRGFYSSSVTAIFKDGVQVIKKLGALEFEDIPGNAQYYLFHSRGPTVETDEFNWDDNHPFTYGNFMVSHNGIIENADALYGGLIGVDSRVVPFLIDQKFRECNNRSDAIRQTLNQLQGTFSLSIFDTARKNISIVRHDTTLFYKGAEFSSSNPGSFTEVPQDTIFVIHATDNQSIYETDKISLARKPKCFIASSAS